MSFESILSALISSLRPLENPLKLLKSAEPVAIASSRPDNKKFLTFNLSS